MDSAPGQAHGAASDAERLIAIIGTMLAELRGTAPPAVSLDDNLERKLGIDSLARVELMLRIEAAFAVRLQEDLFATVETPRDLLRAIADALPRKEPGAVIEPAVTVQPEALGEPGNAGTLLEALDWHVASHPDRGHITLLLSEERADTVRYGELAAEARAVARGLGSRGLASGQTVAIMLPTSRSFFQAFFGVLLAGGVPVPIYPPFRWSQIEDHLRRQARILENCGASMLVTVAEAQAIARLLQANVATLRHVTTTDELRSERDAAVVRAPAAQDIALLQYTSGSTGQPKGVILTHANLLANIRAMGEAVKATSQDTFVSWLPLYHDMGLIGAWLGSLYYGIPLVIMPPTAFLSRPSRWLRVIHQYRATLSAGPNFAYEILASKVADDDLQGLDLGSWRIAFNGAEPVRAATLERFARRFERCGFDARAMAPVYGLAECGLGITFPPLGRGPLIQCIDRRALEREGRAVPIRPDAATAMRVVGCGRPLAGHQVRVVDGMEREAPDSVEGRIEFRGPSATSGYFRNPAATQALMRGDWLDTGDVGYIAGGELYLTSRVKDLIIRGGHNIHPYDLEEAVGNLPGVRKGCVAVFGATDRITGTERVVVLAETRETDAERRQALRDRIADLSIAHLGVAADDIVLASARVVLKTSSGKIRRAACRELYEGGMLAASRRPVALQLARLFLSGFAGRGRALARIVAEWTYALYLWALFVTFTVFAAVTVTLLPGRRARQRLVRGLARAALAISALPVLVEGRGNFPSARTLVVVSNHASYLDSILLTATLPGEVGFAAKRELADRPAVGWLLGRIGVRFVTRFDAQRGVEDTHDLVAATRRGESLAFFPEGTFFRNPGLGPFHMGAFVVSAESGEPVVPVTLRGTRSVLRDGTWLPRRQPIQVLIHSPLRPQGQDWSAALRLRNEARRIILEHCGEPDLGA
ncbi:MAG: AMP-binding protein [Burkholderiales bacterium]